VVVYALKLTMVGDQKTLEDDDIALEVKTCDRFRLKMFDDGLHAKPRSQVFTSKCDPSAMSSSPRSSSSSRYHKVNKKEVFDQYDLHFMRLGQCCFLRGMGLLALLVQGLASADGGTGMANFDDNVAAKNQHQKNSKRTTLQPNTH